MKGAGCRGEEEEEEEVKASHGIGRDKEEEIKRERWKRRHVRREMLVPFEEDTGAAQSPPTSKPHH